MPEGPTCGASPVELFRSAASSRWCRTTSSPSEVWNNSKVVGAWSGLDSLHYFCHAGCKAQVCSAYNSWHGDFALGRKGALQHSEMLKAGSVSLSCRAFKVRTSTGLPKQAILHTSTRLKCRSLGPHTPAKCPPLHMGCQLPALL